MRSSVWIVAMIVAAELLPVPGQRGPKNLRGTLNAYEVSAEKLGVSGSPWERAQAIKALSTVASPRYANMRDRLAVDPSKEVRIALLDAISRMGDGTSEARALLVGNLKSDDTGVLARAMHAVRQLRLRLDFSTVWQREGALATWNQYDRGFGPPLEQVGGIASVRPWKDPAWTQLTQNLRLSLLARAGSREAMVLLAKALETPDGRTPRPWRSWIPAEVVDLKSLREMLDHPRPEISTLASYSLVLARDSEHLSRLGRCLTDVETDLGSAAECSASVMDEQVLRAAIPSLERGVLLALERRDRPKWFWEVQSELGGRGEYLSYEELEPQVTGLRPRRDYNPDPSDAERAAAGYADALKSALIRAMVRERHYEALNPLLSRLLRQSHPFRDFHDLSQALWPGSEFLAGVPMDAAHQSYLAIKKWIDERKPERCVPHNDETGICEALRMLGTLARGDDYEEIWQGFHAAEDPLEDLERLIPVMWGFTERSEALRRLLASAQRQGWFHGGDSFYQLLNATEPAPPPPDPCAGRPHAPSWDPFGVPSEGPSFRALKKTLASDLEEIYPTLDIQALSRDFLELRDLGERIRDSAEALELLWDLRKPIRVAANRLFEGPPPLGPYPPGDPDYSPPNPDSASSRAWIAMLRARLKGFSLAPAQVLPGPALDGKQRTYLEALVKKRKEKFFGTLIEGLHYPSIPPIHGQPPTRALVSLPYAGFLVATPSYLDEVRGLLASPEADLRHGAAWALWLRFRDGAALRVFVEDSRNPDLMVRARALHVLETFRYLDAAPLFPPLLHDSTPELRQVGLWGVQAFRIRSALPEVENLVLDDNAAVAETAIEVLGSLRPPEARPLLLRLLNASDRLAWKASTALAGFRTTSDIDALVARLVDRSTPERERWLILGVLTEITAHPCRQMWNPPVLHPPVGSLAPETIRKWQGWWNHHRSQTSGERFRSSVAALVEQFVKGNDQAAILASGSLARLVPGLSSHTSYPPTEKERQSVQRWWRDARSSDPWTMLTSQGIVPETSIDLAMEIDSHRTRQQLLALLWRDFPSSGDLYYTNPWHQTLVRFAGVDFGDPAAALCDARERILSDWMAWAKKDGWAL